MGQETSFYRGEKEKRREGQRRGERRGGRREREQTENWMVKEHKEEQ